MRARKNIPRFNFFQEDLILIKKIKGQQTGQKFCLSQVNSTSFLFTFDIILISPMSETE